MSSTVERTALLIVLALAISAETGCHRGCSDSSPSSSKPSVVTIGLLAPLTGDAATYGQAIKKGVTLALDDFNASHPDTILTLQSEDTQANPRIGVTAAEKLIQIDKVPAIVGAVASSVTLSVAPIAERSQVVLISPASSSPKITSAGDFIFRNYPSDSLEGRRVAEFTLKHAWQKSSVLVINNDYGTGLRKVFQQSFENGGGEILSSDLYNEGTTDFRAVLLRIKSLSPAALFIVGYGRELGTIARQAREIGLSAQILSTVNFQDPQTLETGGDAVVGAIYSSPIFDPASPDKSVRDFVARFESRFGQEPDVWAAHGYDALLLVAEACAATNCTSKSIRDHLYQTKNWRGVSGETTFDSYGDVEKPVRFMTVKKGEFVPFVD